jgi:hypothetical protein
MIPPSTSVFRSLLVAAVVVKTDDDLVLMDARD